MTRHDASSSDLLTLLSQRYDAMTIRSMISIDIRHSTTSIDTFHKTTNRSIFQSLYIVFEGGHNEDSLHEICASLDINLSNLFGFVAKKTIIIIIKISLIVSFRSKGFERGNIQRTSLSTGIILVGSSGPNCLGRNCNTGIKGWIPKKKDYRTR